MWWVPISLVFVPKPGAKAGELSEHFQGQRGQPGQGWGRWPPPFHHFQDHVCKTLHQEGWETPKVSRGQGNGLEQDTVTKNLFIQQKYIKFCVNMCQAMSKICSYSHETHRPRQTETMVMTVLWIRCKTGVHRSRGL